MTLLWFLPWLLLVLVAPLVLFLRRPRVRSFGPPPIETAPLVSIIVPARNEAANISTCVASLLNSVYPRKEIIVVDDASVDGTSDILRILAEHSNGDLRVVTGEPLPAGWLGKPWACWQGRQRAQGELLLFTDADTRHDETLLGHAVGALQSRNVDLVSVMPRQLMGSFWERLVLPHIFTLIMLRYHDLARVSRTRNPRNVIANGQFLLIRRAAYEAIGGHEALRGAVVEDLSVAQRLIESGRSIFVGYAEELMETRMYRSLRGIVEGWTKNLAIGTRQAVPASLRKLAPWLVMAGILIAWVIPPGLVIASIFAEFDPRLDAWSLLTTALSLLFWLAMYVRMRVSPLYVIGYPLASIIVAVLYLRSTVRGPLIEWKGRSYEVDAQPGTVAGVSQAS